MGKKEIIILGAIGNTPRQNRDNMRILSGGGYHLYAEKPHRQGSPACYQKNKRIAGELNNHQWGVVYYSSGVSPTMQARDYKYPTSVIKKWKSKQSD